MADAEPKNDGFMIFLGFIGVLILLWIASGGPNRPGAYVPPRDRLDITIDKQEISLPKPSVTLPWKATSTEDFALSAFTLSIPTGSQSIPEKEYAIIGINTEKDASTLLTGWILKSDNTGISTTIGRGASLPLLGAINEQSNIFISGSGKAYVTSGRSPLGTSFRENKCTGFLANSFEFTPPLEKRCPSAERLVGTVDRSCSDYLRGLSLCQIPTTLPSYLSIDCRSAIIEKLQYNSCVGTAQNDTDFLTNSWRIYQQTSEDLWRDSRDFVRLMDRLGKTLQTAGY